jgi:hypothetical protein
VRIPRCRATVSEEIRNRSLGKPWEGWLYSSDRKLSSLAKPGDWREPSTPTPFARQRRSACGSFGFLAV